MAGYLLAGNRRGRQPRRRQTCALSALDRESRPREIVLPRARLVFPVVVTLIFVTVMLDHLLPSAPLALVLASERCSSCGTWGGEGNA